MKTTTTFEELRRHGACKERYRHLAKKLGGVKKYGDRTPISIQQIYDCNGAADLAWAVFLGFVFGNLCHEVWNDARFRAASDERLSLRGLADEAREAGEITISTHRRLLDRAEAPLGELAYKIFKEHTAKKLHGSVVEEKKLEGE